MLLRAVSNGFHKHCFDQIIVRLRSTSRVTPKHHYKSAFVGRLSMVLSMETAHACKSKMRCAFCHPSSRSKGAETG